MASEGWDPVAFEFGSGGLEISFEQSNSTGPSRWEYDCNQEGGSVEGLVDALDWYMNDHGYELLFCFRAGTGVATRDGFYLRFFCRRPAFEDAQRNVRWEHRAVGVVGRARETLTGGWTHVATINSPADDGTKMGVYKRKTA